ncbi:MAG: hypothetical protein ABMB14_22780 [Myxococcota bacterium]
MTPDSDERPERLVDALAEIARLRRRLEEHERAGSPDPVVTVDATGTVSAFGAWAWSPAPIVGKPFARAFESASAEVIAGMAERAWFGVAEQRFVLASGRVVSLAVKAVGDGWQIAVRDVTARQLVDRASEQRRRMRALSELAGSLARELTDPMSIVQGRLELLLDLGVSDPEVVRRHLQVALDHARRVTATLQNLRLVGRTAEPSAEPIRLDDAVREALDLVGPRKGQVIKAIEPHDLAIGGDAALTGRVLASLLRQSLEALGRGNVYLRARRTRSQVLIRIGPAGKVGPPRGDPRIDPLGDGELALDRTLLASVGGELVAHRDGTVVQFEVLLPTPPTHRTRRRPVHGRIAVVGTTLSVAIPALLDRDGYEFVTARTADEALVVSIGVDTVIAELLLDGGVSGLSLAEMIANRRSEPLPRLIIVSDGPLPALPPPLVPLRWPVGRAELLEVLGHRVRR